MSLGISTPKIYRRYSSYLFHYPWLAILDSSNSKEHGRIFEFGKMSVIPESDQIKYYCCYIKWWKTLIQCKIPIKIKNHCNFYRIETLRGLVTCFRILNTLQISVELDIFEQLSNQNGCVQCISSTSQLTVQLNVLNWAEHIKYIKFSAYISTVTFFGHKQYHV